MQILKIAVFAVATALLSVTAVANPIVLSFDTLANGSSADLDPVAQANGIKFLSGFTTEDLDEYGDPIPDQFHIEAYSDSDIRVVDPAPFSRGPAPSGSLMINSLFDQLIIRFDTPMTLTSFGFTEDASTFGDLFAAPILLLDANGKTLFEVGPYLPNSNKSHVYDFNFAAISVSQILLPSMSKLYDDIRIGQAAAVPEPASWAMMIGGFTFIGFAMRRRPAVRASFA